MKEMCVKLSKVLKKVFGYGIATCLFAGALSFFGYLVAFIVGGDLAVVICEFIYKQYLPVVIYVSTILVLVGLVSMYLAGEYALTSNKKKNAKHQGEM